MENKLRPGDRLASEKELAESFGVSRQTLREALSALESLGLVELRKGSGGGAYVGEVPFLRPQKSLIDFLHTRDLTLTHNHISEARMMLEPHAARVAALFMSPGQKEALAGLHAEAAGKLTSASRAELNPLETAFHHRITECITNPLLRFLGAVLVNLVDEAAKKNPNISLEFSRRINLCHSKTLEAILKGDPNAAEKAMCDDLALSREIWGELYDEKNADGKDAPPRWVVYGTHVREDLPVF